VSAAIRSCGREVEVMSAVNEEVEEADQMCCYTLDNDYQKLQGT
jgi:hypothetical protein